MLEDTVAYLEEALLEKWDLLLTLLELSASLTSIAKLEAGHWAICAIVEVMKAEEKENCLFPKSLLDTTIWDGGIRERRDCVWP